VEKNITETNEFIDEQIKAIEEFVGNFELELTQLEIKGQKLQNELSELAQK